MYRLPDEFTPRITPGLNNMARSNLMAWEGSPKFRWVKMYKGTRYKVYCREEGWPLTKEGSYQQANKWWEATLATLSPAPPKFNLLSSEARNQLVEAINEERAEIGRLTEYYQSETAVMEAGERRGIAPEITHSRPLRGKAVPQEKTVGPNLERFLELERARNPKPQTYREIANYLNGLLTAILSRDKTNIEVLPASLPCEAIDEQTVTNHYLWLASKNCSPNYGNKRIGFFRRFVRWLKSERLLPALPENIDLKTHRFKERKKAIKKFSGVKEVVESLPERFRLWVMLGLNCSMTQADWGALTWEMIDVKTWVLTRYRVKTDGVLDSPVVAYKLWPETIALLKKLPHREGLVFSTANKTAMYTTTYKTLPSGKVKETKKDLFSTYWNRDIDPKPSIPLGKFRSIGSTCLTADKHFRQYVDVYLANMPDGIGPTFYAAEHDNPFFEALDFIHKQIFGA